MPDSDFIAMLPKELQKMAAAGCDAIGIEQSSEQASAAAKVFACSEYATDIAQRYPSIVTELIQSGRLDQPFDMAAVEAELSSAKASQESESDFMRRLRIFRHRELLRIVWRDLADKADVLTTLADLSAVADICIRVSLKQSMKDHVRRFGRPLDDQQQPAESVVVAMGKLGGQELNFSSDIDLIFLYSKGGSTDGSRSISNEEFFRKVAQYFINLISKQTAEGFAYRVDARLRPFGESGPLACSVASLEDYLAQHGRDWERYAWVKARVVNAWKGNAEFSEKIIRPFVYRRYLDFGVFASLREMKALIEREGRAAANRANIKLGPGGIREIEFIVQTLQLVRGGTIRGLRERKLLTALQVLGREQFMTSETVEALTQAYLYLRALENRLQAIADRQTHELPGSALNRARLCLAMGAPDWDGLLQQLDRHRELVAAQFDELLRHRRDGEPEKQSVEEFSHSKDLTAIAEAYFDDAESALERIRVMQASSVFKRMDDVGQQRIESLLPNLLIACGAFGSPGRALDATLRVLESIGRRSAYIALLNENAAALERLVRLCGSSDFLASQVAAHPLLLDELLDQRIFSTAPSRDDLRKDLQQRLEGADPEDSEQRFEALRNFQQAAVFRVAVADMSGTLPLMKVSDRLTDIAELVLAEATDMSLAELGARYGLPTCIVNGAPRAANFAIAGYGKLGGLELGYGSDLDIVYMHDSAGEQQQTDGQSPIDNAVFFGRLARRITHILTMPTPTGALYEVDTRLRPSGNSGLLVTSLAALDSYQKNDAWTWEHQALLRARAVAGHAGVCDAFEKLRRQALMHYVKRDTLRDEVLKMRDRMRAELNKSDVEKFDLKQGEGGIIDIEFQVQYLVLKYASEKPELIRFSDNIRQLEALQKALILDEEQAQGLADAYRTYRERLHYLSLAGDARLVDAEEYLELRQRVIATWDAALAI